MLYKLTPPAAVKRHRRRVRHRLTRNGDQAASIRALTAARLVCGESIPTPSLADAAVMCGTSITYIEAAKTVIQSEDQELLRRVRRGDVSLIAAAAQVRGLSKLLSALRTATAADRIAAIKTYGTDKAFDEIVAPASA